MKRLAIIFLWPSFLMTFACGGDEECVPLQPGDYIATLTLQKEGCEIGAPKILDILLKLEEGNKFLECGYHEGTSTDYDSMMQCSIISTMLVDTSSENISGKFIMSFKCIENCAGYMLIGNKIHCTDEFDFFAEMYP